MLLKFLYDLEDGDSVDANIVAEASNRLSTGEFQVFQLGYADWYGRDPEPSLLESSFFAYLYHNQVPSWARHFSRRIIAQYDRGELDSNAPHFHRFDPGSIYTVNPATGLAKIIALFVGVTAFLIAGLMLLNGVVPEDQKCNYPPCTWVERVAEEPPPQ